MVNFLSIFCPDLQKLLKPIYDLTRKGRQFIWKKEQKIGKFATGSALYQIQNDKPKLIAYASKRLPAASRNYSITELDMCALALHTYLKEWILMQ